MLNILLNSWHFLFETSFIEFKNRCRKLCCGRLLINIAGWRDCAGRTSDLRGNSSCNETAFFYQTAPFFEWWECRSVKIMQPFIMQRRSMEVFLYDLFIFAFIFKVEMIRDIFQLIWWFWSLFLSLYFKHGPLLSVITL